MPNTPGVPAELLLLSVSATVAITLGLLSVLFLQLLGLVGVRKALKWVFSAQELLWLDELLLEERSVQKGPAQNSLSGSDSEEVSSRSGLLGEGERRGEC